jgi:hypothetical protein
LRRLTSEISQREANPGNDKARISNDERSPKHK